MLEWSMDIIKNIINVIPMISTLFVAALITGKIYIEIRSKFNIKVNCWFCNKNTRIPYRNLNNWYCPKCEQYNGFNENGDYNKEILSQYYESNNIRYCDDILKDDLSIATSELFMNKTLKNGLCNKCNENQRIKIERLSQFETNDDTYNEEIQIYKENLENLYRLCVQCEKNVQKILRDKKKIILGSKLNYLMKKPTIELKNIKTKSIINKNLNTTKNIKSILYNFSTIVLFILSLINFYIVLNNYVEINQRYLNKPNDSMILYIMAAIYSNISAVIVYIKYYLNELSVNIIMKVYLYIKTIIYLLFCTAGFKSRKLHSTYLYVSSFLPNAISIFGILFAFIIIILNKFKMNKYTIILTIWSYSGISSSTLFLMEFLKISVIDDTTLIVCKLILSSIIVILSVPGYNSSSKHLFAQNKNNFHRIYLENYATKNNFSNSTDEKQYSNHSCNLTGDNENLLNSSTSSTLSNYNNRKINSSFTNTNALNSAIKISPPTSSLNFSPTSAFKNYSNFSPTSAFKNYSNFSPTSAFKNYSNLSNKNSFHYFHNNVNNVNGNNPLYLNQFSIYPSLYSENLNLSSRSSLSTLTSPNNINNFEYNTYRNEYLLNSKKDISVNTATTTNNFFKFQRLNLLSPSHFNGGKPEYMFKSQNCFSGGCFNHNNQFSANLRKKTFLNLNNSKENWSRASSQSSGFESQASSTALNNSENKTYNDYSNISRENSYNDGISVIDENIQELNSSSPLSPQSSLSYHSYSYHNPKTAVFIDTHKDDFQKLESHHSINQKMSLNITANSDILNKFSNRISNTISSYDTEQQKEGIYSDKFLYSVQKQQKNKVTDPFDLNIMNKNLSSIQNCSKNSNC